jgi:hypothetical protein
VVGQALATYRRLAPDLAAMPGLISDRVTVAA